MARGVAISTSEIDGTAATLAVKGAHCSLQRLAVGVLTDEKGIGPLPLR
jgi:hypothetical protein